ncbi:uncharacterized protein DNG_06704 [Cephalotrichum gorgonifer]|uniref:Uncharacterized protein n=1 Tax=Cephalotrichum gorgonifer TaxID=2041049 RepID=A0AAE8SWQ1_9PEZI|nr:uncharacterized protein DNG_06704 [Cephalotrichum gorgonifer]
MASTTTATPSPSPPPSPKYEVPSPRLPIEIILQIIQSIVPSPTSLLRVSDPRTKLLISFSRVAHFTYRPSSLLLRRHCASIESPGALVRFSLAQVLSPAFHSDLSWCNIASLYLAPFSESLPGFVVTVIIPKLLSRLSQTLRVLVLDVHCVTHDGVGKNYAVVPRLRDAISRLENLEEFICLECPMVNDGHDPIMILIWRSLPKLKRVLFFNFAADTLWAMLTPSMVPRLEFVWLVDPRHGSENSISMIVKALRSELPRRVGTPPLKKRYTLAVSGCSQQKYPAHGWARLSPEVDEFTKFRFIGGRSSADTEEGIRRVASHLERGTLWDLDAVEVAGGL